MDQPTPATHTDTDNTPETILIQLIDSILHWTCSDPVYTHDTVIPIARREMLVRNAARTAQQRLEKGKGSTQ